MMQRTSLTTCAAFAAIACLAAGTAQAAPSPLTHHGFSSAGSVNVNVGATNQGGNVNAAAGAFSVTWGGNTFFTYCVELTQTAQLNATHNYTLMDGLSYFGTNFAPVLATSANTVMDRLGRLFTATEGINLPAGGVLGNWTYSAAQASAAMQLAVWEIVYEGSAVGGDSFAGLSLAGGIFKENNGSSTYGNIRNLANSYLASAAAVTEVLYDVGVLRNGSFQDYLLVTRQPERNDVPLPGTLALAGLGLAGLAVVRRRRS